MSMHIFKNEIDKSKYKVNELISKYNLDEYIVERNKKITIKQK